MTAHIHIINYPWNTPSHYTYTLYTPTTSHVHITYSTTSHYTQQLLNTFTLTTTTTHLCTTHSNYYTPLFYILTLPLMLYTLTLHTSTTTLLHIKYSNYALSHFYWQHCTTQNNYTNAHYTIRLNTFTPWTTHTHSYKKNPAYGRQSISRPMRIVAPIPQ